MKFIFSIILKRILASLIIYSVCVSSKNIFLRSEEEELSPTCSLPSFTMADRVVVLRGNDMTPVKEISINNRGEDNCYCGNQITEYSISESNITLSEEGDYTCIFYLNDTVSHKHEVLVRKAPKISTTFLEFNEKYTDICCKVDNTMYQNEVKVFFVTGGVTVDGNYVGKKENTNDSSRTTYYLRTDPSHINTTSEILCKVEYFGAVVSLAVNLSEISTRVTPINQSNLLTNEEEEDPYVVYDKKKFDNYTLPGKRVDIECFFSTCGNESISSITWYDTNYPYKPLIGTVKSKDNVEIDFHKEDDYSIVGYDGMLRSTLVIPKAHINNAQCYEAVASMGNFTQKCRHCLLVADQVFFKWYTTRNNETVVICYAASYVTPIILWKVNGVTFTGEKTDASVFVEGAICRKCGASYIIIRDNRDKHTVKKPSCINLTGQNYAREYPIDYEKYRKNKINKLEHYRVLTNLVDLE
ncbi:Immunoglobulin-like domain protein [Canarypox virus]|uniref:CNPV320 Ig-like domain protein n=1 Tax=Canarypox virus TaxID=44088 RepID=Q6VZ27_CNPV|nr:Immunoglobulin-like domain protein [Canarypox virus]AAR83666.1 CNPV320 Ig-like domain protein [Canarypox virus]AWD84796.1 immunoglobulin-like domain protein [Canarypox virus]